jgi:hypothetical protein
MMAPALATAAVRFAVPTRIIPEQIMAVSMLNNSVHLVFKQNANSVKLKVEGMMIAVIMSIKYALLSGLG